MVGTPCDQSWRWAMGRCWSQFPTCCCVECRSVKKNGQHSQLQASYCIFEIYLKFIWLDLSWGRRTLSCSMWDLVPWPGIEHMPPALGAQSLRHRTTGQVQVILYWLLEANQEIWRFQCLQPPQDGTCVKRRWINQLDDRDRFPYTHRAKHHVAHLQYIWFLFKEGPQHFPISRQYSGAPCLGSPQCLVTKLSILPPVRSSPTPTLWPLKFLRDVPTWGTWAAFPDHEWWPRGTGVPALPSVQSGYVLQRQVQRRPHYSW